MIAQNKDMNVAGICTRVPHLPTEIKLSATLIFLTFGILCTCASLKKRQTWTNVFNVCKNALRSTWRKDQ